MCSKDWMSHISKHSRQLLKKKDFIMAKKKNFELNKITLTTWVDKALYQSLEKKT
jgi:hypothetical protein